MVEEESGKSANSVSWAWSSVILALIRDHFPLKASTCGIPSRRDERRWFETLIGWLSGAFMAAELCFEHTEKARKRKGYKSQYFCRV